MTLNFDDRLPVDEPEKYFIKKYHSYNLNSNKSFLHITPEINEKIAYLLEQQKLATTKETRQKVAGTVQ